MASTSVAGPPRSGRADLCSFLTAVDIVLDTHVILFIPDFMPQEAQKAQISCAGF
jgi:hypothetical protein